MLRKWRPLAGFALALLGIDSNIVLIYGRLSGFGLTQQKESEMKTNVKFEEVNQVDYLGHEIKLAPNDSAEYEAVLNDGDALVDTDCGVCLKRNGELYSQINKMNSFKGVSFKSDDGDVISIKLLKIS